MIFTEPRFLFFFVVVLVVHWSLRSCTSRKLWLLIMSYAFYAAWDWRFLTLIAVSTAVDYAVGLKMSGRSALARRLLLAVSVAVNLGILGFFKYWNFFIDSAAVFGAWLGIPIPQSSLEVILPLGISFYTFQTLSYTIDVYHRRLEPTRSLLDLALFVAFFPQLVAGPIVRARNFLPQLSTNRLAADVAVRTNLVLFLIGFVKKTCVADQVAVAVDAVYAAPQAYGAAAKCLASLLYTLQIYCDFSGYSDMAIASAGLLGYRLAENFRAPYLSTSIRDFWNRWHISLSSWFRDYVYFQLEGNRASSLKVARNLWIVFFACGLWHGANWTFVIWGLYHGTFLVAERWLDVSRLPRVLGHAYVVIVVSAGLVIFRSPDLSAAGVYLAGMISSGPADAAQLSAAWWLFLAGFSVIHVLLYRRSLQERIASVSDGAFAVGYGAAVALVLPWVAIGNEPFIYFQF